MSEKKKYLTRAELKALKKQRDDWQVFCKLLDKLTDDLKRSQKFDETYKIIAEFINTSNRLFGKEYEQINNIVNQLAHFVEETRKKMSCLQKEASDKINDIIKLYNNEFDGDLVFNGDVQQWLSRTFPLVKLYVNKKMMDGENNGE